MKISLILPYWDRQEAADKAIERLDALYADLDLEVIVVDDGNLVPFVPPPGRLDIRVILLPKKDEPKSPCTCWNRGVDAATGEIIVLSCIEVLHEEPVLQQLADAVAAGGPDAYVLASAWCPEEGKWHTHSTVPVPECPPGTGLAFLGAMHKELYQRAGGWDEDYRDGAGYEDRDFIHRMTKAGAKFTIRDDLKVIHPKTGARINWGTEKFLRNESLFLSKWTQPVTFVCLKAGTAFGPEYVNILHDMVARNLPAGYPGKFVCLTDDATGLEEGIETLPLPGDLEKWWGKLYLFKRGLFPDGSRMVFMDLDTVILGNLAEIVSYRGQFATLHDFYQPARLGPAVMLWEAGGAASSIWDKWAEQLKPRDPWGDLWWVNLLVKDGLHADVLQTLYPGSFCSFKADCNPYPPHGVKVVCFHGKPRPHEAISDWVPLVWKVGGGRASDLEIVSNTQMEIVNDNALAACQRDLPRLGQVPAHHQEIAIVGGGPSLAHHLDELRARIKRGAKVIALNGAPHFLAGHGIRTDIQVVIDARAKNLQFVRPAMAAEYWLASQCHPDLFDELAGERVSLFHMNTAGMAEILPESEDRANLISSGSTVGLAALVLAFNQGFREITLFGFDSSYGESHHAYDQPTNDGDTVIEATAGGQNFKTTPWMVQQVNEFQILAQQLTDANATINVTGSGLLPHVARIMSEPPKIDIPLNTTAEDMCAQAEANLKRELPVFRPIESHHGQAVIVGGGPSLKENLPKLRFLISRGAQVFAVNGAHDWLIERGIVPNFHVLVDAKQGNVTFVQKPHKDVCYLIAAQCHPDVFDALEGQNVVQWVAYITGIEPILEACGKPMVAVGGGGTVGLKTLAMAHLWGFRKVALFGFDSSYRGNDNHAYPQPMNDAETILDVTCYGRKFRCAPWMIQQGQGFEEQAAMLKAQGCSIKVYGDGLIPWVAQQLEIKNAA